MEPYKERTFSSSSSLRTDNYISAEEFHNLCKSKIRISKSNRILFERYRYPIFSSVIQEAKSSTRVITRATAEEIKSKVSKSSKASERSYENSPTSNYRGSIHKLDPSSCFYWFFLGPRYLRVMIPEIELSRCKTRFTNMLARLPNCHEAHFGLGKIYSHEHKYEKALYHFKEALTYAPNDGTYKLWYGVLYLFTSTSTEGNAKTTKTILESALKVMPKSIEANWALMELALKEILLAKEDIEAPQYYACKIKDLDSYYGYLAWADIYFKQKNQWGKAVSVLKELIKKEPKRPEAYIRLWQWHYEKMQALEPAEEVIEQAYLRASDFEEVQYKVLIYIMYAKTLFKRSKVIQAIEILQQQYIEYPMYPVFLYQFGRMCAKHDSRYAGAAIGALDECLRSCAPDQHGVIAFWLFKAYIGARQHIEALMTARKAVRKLESKEHKKIREINAFISTHNNVLVAREAIKTALHNPLETEEQIEECKMLCSIIKNFDSLVGDMYLAKIYWKSNQREKALKYLELLAENTNFMMKAHFLLIKYLIIMEDYARARIESQNLIIKCKNPMVPTFVWMEAHLIYAKILTYNDAVAKAINILKCLAKVLPPFPNMDIGYIRVLQNSRNIGDLVKASVNAHNFEEFEYEFQNFRTSIVDILQDEYIENISFVSILDKPRYTETKETLENLQLVEEAPASPELKLHKRSPTNFSSRLHNYKNAKKFKSLTIKTDFEQEETELIQTGRYRAAHEDTGVFDNSTSFSVYSDPLFLYKIGKYSGKYNIMPEDGLCAIKDFMRILSYNINIHSDFYELLECKAKYWECIIKKNTNSLTDVEAVCEVLGPKLSKLGQKKKFVRLYEILGKPSQLV